MSEQTHEDHLKMGDFIEGCGTCTKDYKDERSRIMNLVTQTGEVGERLAKDGLRMPEATMLAIRLEALIDTMLGPRDRMQFEQHVGTNTLAHMREAEKASASQPSLVVPNDARGEKRLHVVGKTR